MLWVMQIEDMAGTGMCGACKALEALTYFEHVQQPQLLAQSLCIMQQSGHGVRCASLHAGLLLICALDNYVQSRRRLTPVHPHME